MRKLLGLMICFGICAMLGFGSVGCTKKADKKKDMGAGKKADIMKKEKEEAKKEEAKKEEAKKEEAKKEEAKKEEAKKEEAKKEEAKKEEAKKEEKKKEEKKKDDKKGASLDRNFLNLFAVETTSINADYSRQYAFERMAIISRNHRFLG